MHQWFSFCLGFLFFILCFFFFLWLCFRRWLTWCISQFSFTFSKQHCGMNLGQLIIFGQYWLYCVMHKWVWAFSNRKKIHSLMYFSVAWFKIQLMVLSMVLWWHNNLYPVLFYSVYVYRPSVLVFLILVVFRLCYKYSLLCVVWFSSNIYSTSFWHQRYFVEIVGVCFNGVGK